MTTDNRTYDSTDYNFKTSFTNVNTERASEIFHKVKQNNRQALIRHVKIVGGNNGDVIQVNIEFDRMLNIPEIEGMRPYLAKNNVVQYK